MRGERRVRLGLSVAASAMLALLAGCAENTSIMLVVEGDLRPGVDVDSLLIVVTGGDAERTVGPRALTEADGLPQSLLILPGEVVTERVEARVSASLGPREQVRAERTLAFVAGRQIVYRVCLDRACVGSSAPECLEGTCGDEADADADADADVDADTDSDSDTDTDSDIDSDSDADVDTDPDEPTCDTTTCDDGQFCNGPAVCDGVQCVQGAPPVLEDGILCTVDFCDETGDRVVHTPNDALCADASECTINTCELVGCSVTPRDQDGDGYGDAACGGDDCDDGTAVVNPGEAEACNGWDDDCDGEIDESGCGCDHAVDAGHVYLFCRDADDWLDARGACVGWGYDLVKIDDEAEQDWLWLSASALAAADWWIGLNDRDAESIFEWLDGTIVWEWGTGTGYTDWGGENPTWGFGSDCVVLADEFAGQWNDIDCDQAHPFICELPET